MPNVAEWLDIEGFGGRHFVASFFQLFKNSLPNGGRNDFRLKHDDFFTLQYRMIYEILANKATAFKTFLHQQRRSAFVKAFAVCSHRQISLQMLDGQRSLG